MTLYFGVEVPKKWLNSRYVALFNKASEEIVCPSFWELKWAVGCPFGCTYCYLQGTLFGKKQPKLKNLRGLSEELDEFLGWCDQHDLHVLLNAGELCDSLAIPHWTADFLETVSEVLEKHNGHRVLLVSKGGVKHIEPLLDIADELRTYFVASFSINSSKVAREFELGTPSPSDRMEAARILFEEGFEVRIRIDPIIPVRGWEESYLHLVESLLDRLSPTRITLGTLRGLRKTIKFSKKREWYQFLRNGEKTGWGLKMRFGERMRIYRKIIEKLRELGFGGEIALCKETLEMWMALKDLLNSPQPSPDWAIRCNCTF